MYHDTQARHQPSRLQTIIHNALLILVILSLVIGSALYAIRLPVVTLGNGAHGLGCASVESSNPLHSCENLPTKYLLR